MTAMTEITCKCGCGRRRLVRTADVKRGWGKYFSKGCKAKQQSATGGSNKYYKIRNKHRHYQREYGGNPAFDRNGEYIGFTLSPECMAEGNVQ